MNRLLLLCVLFSGCGAGGDTGGGAENLPNRGFAPYVFDTDDDGQAFAVIDEDQTIYTHPMAHISDGILVLYLSRCTDDEPCTIAVAESADGLIFSKPKDICTDSGGLEHPFIEVRDGRKYLWATRNDSTEIVSAILDAGGRCTQMTTHFKGQRDEQLSSLSVLRVDGTSQLIFARLTNDKKSWFVQPLPDGQPNPLTPCDDDASCWIMTRFTDGEFRVARSRLGNRVLRSLLLGQPSRTGNTLAYRLARGQRPWSRYGDGLSLSIDKGITSVSQTRFGDMFFLYGAMNGRIYVGVNDEGHASDLF